MSERDDDKDVSFDRTPPQLRATRWKKGQSENPTGKRKRCRKLLSQIPRNANRI